jgi:hypothetical protein
MTVGRYLLSHPPRNLAELDALFALVKRLSGPGRTLILGEKRCFICGCELGDPVPDAFKRVGGGPTKVFMRLCEDCFAKVKA